MKKLTIGSAVYDDFDGIYFSYQSIRLNNLDILDDLDLIVLENNPTRVQGQATKHFCEQSQGIRYIPYTQKTSTSIRNSIFEYSEAEFCMSIDSHVLFEPNTIRKLIDFLAVHSNSKDLYHGPMFFDSLNNHDPCAKMDPIWRGQMYGVWAYDERANDPSNLLFEIDMHGLGVFLSRTDSWLGFNEHFNGFGGEEGYIHKKYQLAHRKTWCLPFLRWLHRFDRPNGAPYQPTLYDKIKNYFIGCRELGFSASDVISHFAKEIEEEIPFKDLIAEVNSLDIKKFSVNSSHERKAPKIKMP